MNVNSGEGKRIRRTPEESKSLILRVAADRLGELGLEGLNIAGVAKAAGMSHATVIHHFGSTAAMREALLAKMTGELLTDVMEALDHQESPEKVLDHLFKTLSGGGHGRLLAWLALDRQEHSFKPAAAASTGSIFSSIIKTIGQQRGDATHAKHLVFLVAVAAMGLSISGDSLANLVGLSDKEREDFPGWLAELIQTL